MSLKKEEEEEEEKSKEGEKKINSYAGVLFTFFGVGASIWLAFSSMVIYKRIVWPNVWCQFKTKTYFAI
jgi:hypothetical protein